jgi:predicted cobalt transporter CbtA
MGPWDWLGCLVVGFVIPNPVKGQPSGLNPIVEFIVDIIASTLAVALFWAAIKLLIRWTQKRKTSATHL